MKKASETIRDRVCPNGKVTRSTKQYLKEWYAIIRPFEKRMNMQVLAFDPDIQLAVIEDGKIKQSMGFPLWVVDRIMK